MTCLKELLKIQYPSLPLRLVVVFMARICKFSRIKISVSNSVFMTSLKLLRKIQTIVMEHGVMVFSDKTLLAMSISKQLAEDIIQNLME